MNGRTPADLERLMDAALGHAPVDLLLRGGTVLDVYRGQWVRANVGIAAGRVATFGDREPEATEVLDVSGKHVVPGFFEPHFHAGGSHLAPAHLAHALLQRGTTATVCDFQEHYCFGGLKAARWAIDATRAAGLKVFYLAPLQQFVVRSQGISGIEHSAEDMLEMLGWPETVAVNEPPPAALFSRDPGTLRVVSEALGRGLIYSGHAPEVSGADLEAYASTGASSDHESRDAGAAWMKLGLGMKVIMREGSAAPDLAHLLQLARDHVPASRHMSMGSDEVDPIDLVDQGHMDHKVRMAIAAGVDPVVAFQMATLNPAEYYRLDHDIGSLAPGRSADAVILDDLDAVGISAVIAGGRVVAPTPEPPADGDMPDIVRSRIVLPRRLRAEDLRVAAPGTEARVRLIEVADRSLVSGAGTATVPVHDGAAVADPGQDVLKAVMIDPYSGRADTGVGFVRGFGFRDGAVATTYQNPYWNLFAVGTSDEAIAQAANELADMGGGIAVVSGGEVVARWHLPMAMVFSTSPLSVVSEEFRAINQAIRDLGCDFKAPVLALTFTPLVTIPAYGLSSKGLFDVASGAFVSPLLDGDERA
jgi:adenine deaminase